MKPYRIILLLAGIMMLAGCEKSPYNELEGRWKPVFASGTYDDAAYVHSFNGPVDEHGVIPQVYVSKTNPDVKYESTMTIVGFNFFRKDGKDYFTTFFMDTPNEKIYEPLMYKIEGGMIYRELPWTAIVNGSTYGGIEDLLKGSGKFDEGRPISFLDDGQVKIGDTTYQRMD